MRGKWSLFLLVTGFLLYFFDVGSDLYVAVRYCRNGEYWWFGITIALIIVPSVIVNISAFINILDISKHQIIIKLLVCVFQLSVTQRYWEEFKQWKKTNWDNKPCQNDYWVCHCQCCESYLKEKTQSANYATSLAQIRYTETFAESAPQWCLQNYIMLRQWSFPWITITSTVFSLLSLAWSVTSLKQSAKIEDEPKRRILKRSMLTYLVWQLGILVSRLSAIVTFAYVFRSYVFVVIGLHWTAVIVVMLINYYRGDSRDRYTVMVLIFFKSHPLLFHTTTFSSDLMFDNFGAKIRKILSRAFYFVIFLENIIMVSLSVWYNPTNTAHIKRLQETALPLVLGGFRMGILFQILYYSRCHPSKMAREQDEAHLCNNMEHPELSKNRADIHEMT